MAAITSFTYSKTRPVKRVAFAFTSHTDGVASAASAAVSGEILRVVSNPGASAPDANWDFTITDADGFDVCLGLGANRHTSDTQQFVPLTGDGTLTNQRVAVDGPLTFNVSNAGNTKNGTITVYYPVTNWYVSLDRVKAALGLPDTNDDAFLRVTIENVSRTLEKDLGHWFYPRLQTRYLAGSRGGRLLTPDLLSVSSLKGDQDSDRTYEETWAVTDFDLYPHGAAQETPPRPYWAIQPSPLGRYSFPCAESGVEVVGVWGYSDTRRAAGTLGAALTDTVATTGTLTAGHTVESGQTILVDAEQIFVGAVSTNAMSGLVRGVNGTTATTHLNAAPVEVYEYPLVSQPALQQVCYLHQLKNTPGTDGGSASFGPVPVSRQYHPFVYDFIRNFRRRRIA